MATAQEQQAEAPPAGVVSESILADFPTQLLCNCITFINRGKVIILIWIFL